MADLKHLETSYTDVYQTDLPLRAFNDHPPIRATRVIVTILHLPDEGGDHTAKVRVAVTGEKIIPTATGFRTEGHDIRVYGLAEEPVRYTLCRDAVLTTLERHQVSLEQVADFGFLEEWADHVHTSDSRAVDLSGAMSPEVSTTGLPR